MQDEHKEAEPSSSFPIFLKYIESTFTDDIFSKYYLPSWKWVFLLLPYQKEARHSYPMSCPFLLMIRSSFSGVPLRKCQVRGSIASNCLQYVPSMQLASID